ncbi:unnamed protein product [Phaeothamnion confervicola]
MRTRSPGIEPPLSRLHFRRHGPGVPLLRWRRPCVECDLCGRSATQHEDLHLCLALYFTDLQRHEPRHFAPMGRQDDQDHGEAAKPHLLQCGFDSGQLDLANKPVQEHRHFDKHEHGEWFIFATRSPPQVTLTRCTGAAHTASSGPRTRVRKRRPTGTCKLLPGPTRTAVRGFPTPFRGSRRWPCRTAIGSNPRRSTVPTMRGRPW